MYSFNNYMPQAQNQIIKVNGQNGAQAFQMFPNCSALLLDETAPRAFLVQTDGAGYKTINAYKLIPDEPPKQTDMEDIVTRINRLEKIINEQSNTRHGTSSESNQRNAEKSKQKIQ